MPVWTDRRRLPLLVETTDKSRRAPWFAIEALSCSRAVGGRLVKTRKGPPKMHKAASLGTSASKSGSSATPSPPTISYVFFLCHRHGILQQPCALLVPRSNQRTKPQRLLRVADVNGVQVYAPATTHLGQRCRDGWSQCSPQGTTDLNGRAHISRPQAVPIVVTVAVPKKVQTSSRAYLQKVERPALCFAGQRLGAATRTLVWTVDLAAVLGNRDKGRRATRSRSCRIGPRGAVFPSGEGIEQPQGTDWVPSQQREIA